MKHRFPTFAAKLACTLLLSAALLGGCEQIQFQQAKPAKAALTIDVAKTAEPISEYVYGQFIEHLGQCIYDGLWAEMLHDRKFYFPITDEYKPWTTPDPNYPYYRFLTGSPWRIYGSPTGSVKMTTDNPFVGEHCPIIQVPGDGTPKGIEHDELLLIQGREYTGRIVLAGDPEAAPVIVALIWRDEPGRRDRVIIDKISPEFTTYPLNFKAGATANGGILRIVSRSKGTFKVGAVSLMPAENVNGMRPNTLSLLKQLNAPIYRWPGGNFVSGYNWLDGIGAPDKRPPRKNPAWTGVEHNDFGIHEFMTLCRLVNAKPLVVVNSGLGDANSAAKLVQYCNGDQNSPMGKLRAENGSVQPFSVKWWGIGNEMYGDWQLGHVPIEDYVKKHNDFADAMRAVDPSIKLIAVGAVGAWSQQMLTSCADRMDLISEHFYCGLEGQSPTWQHTPLPIDQLRSRPEGERQAMLLKHVAQIPDQVKRITDAHRKYRTELDSLKDKDIRIAIDEYNYWYGPYLYGEIGTRFYLQDALGIAAGLHEIFRNSDIVAMANYAQTVNVIGAIKTTKISAAFETTGLVLKMYRERFGQIPVEISGQFSPLDVAAAWTKDKDALTIAVVNPTMRQARLMLDIQNAKLSGEGASWQIAGSDPLAYNEPEFAPQVVIEEKQLTGVSKKFTVPPLSITIYKLMTTK